MPSSPSPFTLSQALETISVATTRVLPTVLANPEPQALYNVIVALNPLVTSCWLLFIQAVSQVIVSAITGSITWNDRAWSLIPVTHALLYALHPVLSRSPRDSVAFDARLCILLFLISAWGLRLTVHAFFRGVYSPSSVDYRYAWIRQQILRNRFLFAIFYVTFVCCALTFLTTLVTTPVYFAWIARHKRPLSWLDALASLLTSAAILLEAVADRQQQRFQQRKHAANARTKAKQVVDEEIRDGFLQSGLYAHCRHPNFFAEMCVWFSIYLFSIAAGGPVLNWTLAGPLLYTALFQGSTAITEHLSKKKYGRPYADYQRRVPRLIPSLSARRKPGHGDKQQAKKTD